MILLRMTKYIFEKDDNVIDDLEHPQTLAFLFNVVIAKMEHENIRSGQFGLAENRYDIEDKSTPNQKVFHIRLADPTL